MTGSGRRLPAGADWWPKTSGGKWQVALWADLTNLTTHGSLQLVTVAPVGQMGGTGNIGLDATTLAASALTNSGYTGYCIEAGASVAYCPDTITDQPRAGIGKLATGYAKAIA